MNACGFYQKTQAFLHYTSFIYQHNQYRPVVYTGSLREFDMKKVYSKGIGCNGQYLQ
jgi:hypothetical protein